MSMLIIQFKLHKHIKHMRKNRDIMALDAQLRLSLHSAMQPIESLQSSSTV